MAVRAVVIIPMSVSAAVLVVLLFWDWVTGTAAFWVGLRVLLVEYNEFTITMGRAV